MAERTSVKSPVSAFATRLGPALSIGIVLGAVLIAFLIGLWLTFGGDLGPLADPIPNQNQPTEESVPTEEPFPTNTPSPTATEIPPTDLKFAHIPFSGGPAARRSVARHSGAEDGRGTQACCRIVHRRITFGRLPASRG